MKPIVLAALVALATTSCMSETKVETTSEAASANLHQFKAVALDGTPTDLAQYKGKVVLVVNTASECGYTRQYKGLQELHASLESRGFTVLGVPCNDFGGQEPGSLEEIKTFCSTTYGASFTLFDKVHATGATTEPYTTLNQVEPAGPVAWNFEKFLVGRDGTVLARYGSRVEPDAAELTSAIEAALG